MQQHSFRDSSVTCTTTLDQLISCMCLLFLLVGWFLLHSLSWAQVHHVFLLFPLPFLIILFYYQCMPLQRSASFFGLISPFLKTLTFLLPQACALRVLHTFIHRLVHSSDNSFIFSPLQHSLTNFALGYFRIVHLGTDPMCVKGLCSFNKIVPLVLASVWTAWYQLSFGLVYGQDSQVVLFSCSHMDSSI